MSKRKRATPFAISVDGKLLAGERGVGVLRASSAKDSIDKIEVEIIPKILGGAKNQTLTGTMGDFLPKPVDFRITSMKVEGRRCVVKYARVSDRAC